MPFPVEPRFIDETERKLGARFPASFRQKMLVQNGGTITISGEDWELHPVFDSSDKKRLCRTCNDIVRETGAAKQWRGFPATGVAIAANGCGDHLVFLVSDSGNMGPEVHVWLHETGETQVVATDFAELVQ